MSARGVGLLLQGNAPPPAGALNLSNVNWAQAAATYESDPFYKIAQLLGQYAIQVDQLEKAFNGCLQSVHAQADFTYSSLSQNLSDMATAILGSAKYVDQLISTNAQIPALNATIATLQPQVKQLQDQVASQQATIGAYSAAAATAAFGGSAPAPAQTSTAITTSSPTVTPGQPPTPSAALTSPTRGSVTAPAPGASSAATTFSAPATAGIAIGTGLVGGIVGWAIRGRKDHKGRRR
jgi:hypothetical protein